MGFFDWLNRRLTDIRRMLEGQPVEPEQPTPVPEPYPYQDIYEYNNPEYYEEEPQPLPPEEEHGIMGGSYEETPLDECNVFHDEGGQKGRAYVYPRWRAVNPDMDCIRDMFRIAGPRASYALVVCGSPSSEYPGHENEPEHCLTYKFEGLFMRSIVSRPDIQNAQDFATAVNDEYPERLVEGWDTCTEVAILDERE